MGRIPSATKTDSSPLPIGPFSNQLGNLGRKMFFSFEALEQTEYFNLSGTCQNWASDMLNMCKAVSSHTVEELRAGKLRTFRFHSLNGAPCPEKLPSNVELKDMYQLRISTSKGGIHGVLVENMFYVIWLDPLHNMYPDDKFGGLRKIREGSTCCKDRDNEILSLCERIAGLECELEEAQGLVELYSQDVEKYKTALAAITA